MPETDGMPLRARILLAVQAIWWATMIIGAIVAS